MDAKHFLSSGAIRARLVPVLLFLAVTFAIYAGCFGHSFLSNWDDDKYVTANATVQALNANGLKQAFSTFYVGNYAPFQILSYMADYALWGMRPAGFIFTNVLLHALNGILFYLLLAGLAGSRRAAFIGAFCFLCHPVQVESVAWISQRKNVLAMFFFLVALLLYRRYRSAGESGRGAYAGSVAAFVAALLSKSVTVILPPLLVLYDLCFVPPAERRRWLVDKLPYLTAALVVGLVALKSQQPEYVGGRTSWHGGSPYATFLTMLPVLVRYLGMLVWPVGLSAVYAPSVRTVPDGVVAGAVLVLLATTGVGWYLYRRQRRLFFWYALYWLGLLPVSQIVPLVTLINDRYLYFPLLGPAALAGIGIARLWEGGAGSRRRLLAGFLLVPLLALPYLSFVRSEVWRDAITLWRDATVEEPASKNAWIGLAEALHSQQRLVEAAAAYERAIAIDPRYRDALNNLGVLWLDRGEPLRARYYLFQVVTHYPNYPEGFLNLGHTYLETGELDRAELAYRQALALAPGSPPVLTALGGLLLRTRRLAEADDYLRQASAVGGETADLLYNRACVAALGGRSSAALDLLGRAVSAGYRDFSHLAKDDDLASLHGLPEFQRLLRTGAAERSK